jgi:hypothetical protein
MTIWWGKEKWGGEQPRGQANFWGEGKAPHAPLRIATEIAILNIKLKFMVLLNR